MCDDELTNNVKLVVGDELDDLRNHAVAVSLAEGRVVEAVDDNWRLSRQCEAVGLNLGKSSGDGVGVEDPAALCDGGSICDGGGWTPSVTVKPPSVTVKRNSVKNGTERK